MKKYFHINELTNLESLKQRYRTLSKKYHPDHGGDTAVFQEINRQYRQELEIIKQRAKRENDKNLYRVINEQIISIDKYIEKSQLPQPLKPAISYLLERGINEIGRIIKERIESDEIKPGI